MCSDFSSLGGTTGLHMATSHEWDRYERRCVVVVPGMDYT
mgnify:CR=1 FL=1